MIVCFGISVASRSPSAYDEIRASNILVLPSRKTLRDYRNAIRPKVGFNPDVINELKNVTKNLNGIQRFICLCFDEIKVQSSLVFNKYTDELIDFIDLGDPDTNYSTFSDLDKLASHILVYYVKGLYSDLKFAFAYFATHGVTSFQIMTTFWKAISILEITCKLPIITVVSDGASPNRKFYNLHAPLDKLNTKDVTYRTINLFEPRHYIWFLQMLCIFSKQLEIVYTIQVMQMVHNICGRKGILFYGTIYVKY